MAGRARTGEAVAFAFQFMRAAAPKVAPVLIAIGVAVALANYLEMANSAWRAAPLLIYVILSVMAVAALLRLGLSAEQPENAALRPRPGGFQWNVVEWRLVGAGLIIGVISVLIILAGLLAILGVLAAMTPVFDAAPESPQAVLAMLGDNPAAIIAIVAIIVLDLAVLVFVSIRLSLAQAATVAENRVATIDTFRLTKGHFWPLLLAVIVADLPSFAGGIVQGSFAEAQGAGAIAVALIAGAVTPISIVLVVAVTLFFYKRLRPEGFGSVTVFD